jgi:hypothetical protein
MKSGAVTAAIKAEAQARTVAEVTLTAAAAVDRAAAAVP